ncbi:MAG: glycogen debranching protein, partial [Armatimonadetes bacterium]|nr:glycogen debranching protein [Armatimonadota bacterium]
VRQRAGSGEGGREDLGVDVPLWFAWAARHYLQATGDVEFAEQVLCPAIRGVVERLSGGQIEGVELADDGLVTQGRPDLPLTWMDALCQGEVFTPRRGKAVEVNALWHLTLCLGNELGLPYEARLEQVRASFLERFWSAKRGYLLDVVDGPEGDDASFRPNQLLAVSLHEALLPDTVARAVVDEVTARLLTPYGLRTLAAGDPRYRERYEGHAAARDAAYHNGTVWPWLLGPYADALRRFAPADLGRLAALLAPFAEHLGHSGLGQVSEIFDAEPPHWPRGCIAHAPAVGELLRVAAMAAGETAGFWPPAGPSRQA